MSQSDLPDLDTMFSPEYWDGRYGGVERAFSGRPNARLVEVVDAMAPGRALDLGAGEGGDAAWLAERGWDVVAVDVSQVALDRAAATIGSERITWRQADLRSWEPTPGEAFDLVTMHYLHLPPEHHRRLLRLLHDVVRPGGSLLHVGHHRDDIAVGRWDVPELMPPAAEVAAVLDPELWEVVRADDPTRLEHRGHGHGHRHGGAGGDAGEAAAAPGAVEVRDTVVHAVRR